MIRLLTIVFYASLVTTPIHEAMAKSEKEAAIDYVTQLPSECVYNDGYQCVTSERSEATPFANSVDESGALPALVLEAWPIALTKFRSLELLSSEQKKLKHYKVSFRVEEDKIVVLFRPLLLPRIKNDKIVGRLRAALGIEAKIWVNLTESRVENVLLGKF